MELVTDYSYPTRYPGSFSYLISGGDAVPVTDEEISSPAGTVSDGDFTVHISEDGTVSPETLQRYYEEQHAQYQMLNAGMLMIAIFLGMIVGILLIQAFWHGGNH